VTPGARLAAAIELIAAIERGAVADREIGSYFRTRRYAGSKDRAAISTLVYDCLRRRGIALWGLERVGLDPNPRHLALELLVRGRGEPAEAVFTGEGHAPARLDDAERAAVAALNALDDGAAPAWARLGFPAWLESELRARFGEDLETEMAALNRRAAVDLRVNALKAVRPQVTEELARLGVTAAPTPLSPLGLRIEGERDLSRLPPLRDGLVEIQDEGSQIVALMVEARPGEQVVDFCAGAGGKTLALAAQMRRQGQVYALDSDAARLERLKPRARRAGAHNIQPHVLAGADDPWLKCEGGRFDRVLVDAPCSGMGAWRRAPEARWRLTGEILARHVMHQGAILSRAASLVRPGGRLIYAVCSLLPVEGEGVVGKFLSDRHDFASVPAADVWASAIGSECPADASSYLVLTPARHGCDGFFVAVLERRAGV